MSLRAEGLTLTTITALMSITFSLTGNGWLGGWLCALAFGSAAMTVRQAT